MTGPHYIRPPDEIEGIGPMVIAFSICAMSGAIMGALVVGVIWWLS